MKKLLSLTIFLLASVTTYAMGDSISTRGVIQEVPDSINTVYTKRPSWFKRTVNNTVSFFSPEVDTTYIEPQQYNFTAMLQLTNSHDHFLFRGDNENHIRMSPEFRTKLGPFFGWRWLFFGYTFSINALNISSKKLDINTSIYTPCVGIDFIYRKLGDDYRIRSFKFANIESRNTINGISADGLDINMLSINVYYILNKHHYSHSAAFNQSGRQIHSAGSWILGSGYTSSTLSMDWQRLEKQINLITKIPNNSLFPEGEAPLTNTKYKSIPFSVGYGYNWAFAPNWLFAVQGMGSLSYMWSVGDTSTKDPTFISVFKDMRMNRFTIDGTARVGLVWNNSRWFAGANAIYHTYSFHNSQVRTYNVFGSIYLYLGFNFFRK